MSSLVTEEDVERYNEDGVICIRGLVEAEELDSLAAAIEEDIRNPGPFYHGYSVEGGKGRFHGNMRLWETNSAFKNFIFHSKLPEAAQTLFGGGRVNLLYDQLFVKVSFLIA